MLFVPPSMSSMIPEVEAVQDRGDFIVYYGPTDSFTKYEKFVKSSKYLENKVKYINKAMPKNDKKELPLRTI